MTVTGPLEGGKPGASGVAGRDGAGGGRGARGKPGAGGKDGATGGGTKGSGGGTRTRLLVRLRGAHRSGATLTVPFAAAAHLAGRLVVFRKARPAAGGGSERLVTDGGAARPATEVLAGRPAEAADPRPHAGGGLAGRWIKVVAVPSHGALARRTVTRVRTGRRGAFSLRLPAGTSRRLVVSFPGDGSLAPSRRRTLQLRVRAGLTLKARPAELTTGETLHFSGRVRARDARVPRRGKLVAIQYLEADTGRWRPVLVTRTDAEGRFDARYRFRYITGAARIRLRATALPEADWPYAPGSSPPVTVEVHG
jgi:hypothetical protein